MPHAPLALALASAFWLPALVAQSPHNVLVVVADDLGPEMLGCYGGVSPATTPVLDRLASTGLRFRRAYATPLCSPSRAALLTGRYGFRTGVTASLYPRQQGLPLAELTLPEALSLIATPSALFGKWHLGDANGDQSPNAAGWPHFAGFLQGGVADYFAWPRVVDGVAAPSTNYATSQQVDDALAWIGRQSKPWLAMVSFAAPHSPFHAPPAHLHTENLQGLDPQEQQRAFYRAMVQALDAEIGRLLTGLGSARADTVVVFVGDNGTPREVTRAAFGPPRQKGTLYEGGVRVPLIVQGPAVTTASRVCDELVGIADLFPTLLELRGASLATLLPPGVPYDGVSFLPLLRGQPGPLRVSVYTEITRAGLGDGWAMVQANHKFLRFTGGGAAPHDELYDLAVDPTEQLDLLAQPGTPALAALAERFGDAIFALRRQGSALRFGSGCAGTAGIPRLQTWGVPTLGDPLYFRTDQGTAGTAFSITILGASRTSHMGMPLPLDLGSAGMPGCALQAGLDVVAHVGVLGSPGSLPIPADPGLTGARLYLQSFVTAPGVNRLGFVASPPLGCRVGE